MNSLTLSTKFKTTNTNGFTNLNGLLKTATALYNEHLAQQEGKKVGYHTSKGQGWNSDHPESAEIFTDVVKTALMQGWVDTIYTDDGTTLVQLTSYNNAPVKTNDGVVSSRGDAIRRVSLHLNDSMNSNHQITIGNKVIPHGDSRGEFIENISDSLTELASANGATHALVEINDEDNIVTFSEDVTFEKLHY